MERRNKTVTMTRLLDAVLILTCLWAVTIFMTYV